MADVTINELTKGTPTGGNVLPYSTGANTVGVPVSALFHNAGNIGIGTVSPSYLLDLRQNYNGALVNIEGSSDNIAIRLKNNQAGGREYRIISTAQGSGYGAGALALEDQASGSARLLIDSTGNVSIPGKLTNAGVAKAWVSFNGQGVVSQNQPIYSQYNISSVVKAADGMYTVNFNNALPDSNYCIIGSTGGTGGYGMAVFGSQWGDSEGGLQTTTSFRIGTYSPQSASWRNMSIVNVAVYGS